MVRSWPAEGGWLWITQREKSSGEEKTRLLRRYAGPVGFFFLSASLSTSEQIHKVHGGFLFFFFSQRETKVCLQRSSYLCFAERSEGRREPFAASTWHMICNPTKTTKLAVQRWHREQLPAGGEKKETESRSNCRTEVEKHKGNRGGACVCLERHGCIPQRK